jgi:hypothetical protein
MTLSDLNKLTLPVVVLCRTEDKPVMFRKEGEHWVTEDVAKMTAEDMVAKDWKILNPTADGFEYQDQPNPKVTR